MGTSKSLPSSLHSLDDGWTLDETYPKTSPPPVPRVSMSHKRRKKTGPAAFSPILRIQSPVKGLRPEDLEEFSTFDLALGTGVDMLSPDAAWFLELREIIPAKIPDKIPSKKVSVFSDVRTRTPETSNTLIDHEPDVAATTTTKPSSWWRRIRNK